MARATLSRRLLTLATGLVVGMASAFAGATTATAAQSHAGFPFDGIFQPVCDGTHVTLIGMPETAWTVEAGEQQFWPIGDESGEVALGEVELVFVPADAGEIVVSVNGTAVTQYTWEGGDILCDFIPAPTFTEGSCDTPATVSIPSELDEDDLQPATLLSKVLPEVALQQMTPAGSRIAAFSTPEDFLSASYRLNGEPVEFGSTHELEPGNHIVSFHITASFSDIPFNLDLRLHSWAFEVPALDCEEPGDEPGDDSGTGGELPVTGTTATLIAAGAVLLLALGTGAYLIARRRRVTFTA